jgi:hypothetical protein
MRFKRFWPAYGFLAAAVLGGVFLGFGGVVVVPMIAMLVIGPAYLVQQRVRRRRGVAPSGRGLDRDADEAMTRFAAVYLQAVGRSRLVRVCVYAGNIALVAGLWVFAGSGWALASVGLWLALTALAVIQGRLRSQRR